MLLPTKYLCVGLSHEFYEKAQPIHIISMVIYVQIFDLGEGKNNQSILWKFNNP